MLDVDPAMSGRVESWGPTAHLLALRSGFIAPRGGRLTCWRRRIQYDRERGGGKLHALTM